MRKPVRIDQFMTDCLLEALRVRDITVPSEVKLYVTNTRCGRFSSKNMNITVPTWALELKPKDARIHENNPEYAIYYACHEIAHVLTRKSRVRGVMHSPEFYEAFKDICPPHLHFLEIGYKPTLAAAAGISR